MKPTFELAALALGLGFASAQQPAPKPKLELQVLYAGDLSAARTQEWREFLGRAVEKVATTDIATLSEKDAEGYDVVIVDTPHG